MGVTRNILKALLTAIAVLAACAAPAGAGSYSDDYGIPTVDDSLTLAANESKSRFDFDPAAAVLDAGVIMITVEVPKDATGKHGVAIDGGVYSNIEGAAVKPGRSTSLTIDLQPGTYTVYDPYKNNRMRGFSMKITVVDQSTYGRGCSTSSDAVLNPVAESLRVAHVKCRVARRVARYAYEYWIASPPSEYYAPPFRRFLCSYEDGETFTGPASGVRATCVRRSHKGPRFNQIVRFTFTAEPPPV